MTLMAAPRPRSSLCRAPTIYSSPAASSPRTWPAAGRGTYGSVGPHCHGITMMHQGSGHEERTEQGRRGRERAEDEEGNTGERQAAGGQGRDTQQATEKKKKKKRAASRQSGQQLEAARSSRGSSSGRDNGWVVVIHQVHPAAQPNPFGLREERGARQRSGQEDGRQGALRPRRGARPPLCHGRPAMAALPCS